MLVCEGIFEQEFDPLQNAGLPGNLGHFSRTDDNTYLI